VAPDAIRCERAIATSGGGSTRCSRFTLKKADGSRDRFCLAHSQSEQGEALRSKAAKAQTEALEAERARRQHLLACIAPAEWKIRDDFNWSRWAVLRALALGDVTAADARELRALIADAERSAQTFDYDWDRRYLAPG
jgi:hypothetical protein